MSKVIRDKGYTLDRDRWEWYAIIRSHDPVKAKKYKTKLRHEYKHEDSEWKVVFQSEDGENITLKRFFTGTFDDEEWKDFVNCTWVEIFSPYDCTGKLFSWDLSRYEVPGGTWVYHRMALDV